MVRKSPSIATISLLFLLVSPFALALDSNFTGLYPEQSLPCLNKASDQSNCNGAATSEALNECLCTNTGGFVVNTAKCLGNQADLVKLVYKTMSDACLNTETPVTVSQSDFYAIAEGKQDGPSSSSTTSSTSTTSATSTSAHSTETGGSKDEAGGGGLSTGAIAGIGAGIGVVAIAAFGGLITWCIRRRRRTSDESHPMLPTENSFQNGNPYHNSTTFPPTEPSSVLAGQYSDDHKSGAERWSTVSGLSPGGTMAGYSPSMTNNTASPPVTAGTMGTWGGAASGWNGEQQQYAGTYNASLPHGGAAELPNTAAPVYEMDAGHGAGYAAELSGSVPHQPYQHYDQSRR